MQTVRFTAKFEDIVLDFETEVDAEDLQAAIDSGEIYAWAEDHIGPVVEYGYELL